MQNLVIPLLSADQAAGAVGNGLLVPSTTSELAATGNGSIGGIGLGSTDFMDRIGSNGGAAAAGPTRHERLLKRRRQQRIGRRAADAPAPPGSDEEAGTDQRGTPADFAAWGGAAPLGAGGRQEQRRGAPPAAPRHDSPLDSLISRLLAPQHDWRSPALPRPAPAAGASGGEEDELPAESLERAAGVDAPALARWFADLSRSSRLRSALQLLEVATSSGRSDALQRLSHKTFIRAAQETGDRRAVLRFLQLLPAEAADDRTYNMALHACAAGADLDAARRVVALMAVRGAALDAVHTTTLISAAARAGDLGAAFSYYSEARQAAAAGAAAAGGRPENGGLDGWVFGALVAACAAGIKAASGDRKEQLVLLERAFGLIEDAAAGGVHLEAPVWNALLLCAGRSRQLQRAFEVLDMMQTAGCRPDGATYCALIESCALAREPALALRVFRRAQRDGAAGCLQVYTAAINACMLGGGEEDLDAALEVYAAMGRSDVEPDDLVYGNLIALAGAAGKLDSAFEILEDMRAGGLLPGGAACSALMYACMQNGDLAAARKVFDTLASRGVAPHVSQFNALLEQYALRYRLGDVAAVLTNMVDAGAAPNANTYRILLLACQRADQAELAFEVYHVMRLRKVHAKDLNAQSICHSLLKCCLNRLREAWVPGGYPPRGSGCGGGVGVVGAGAGVAAGGGGGMGGGGGGGGAAAGAPAVRPEAWQLLSVLERGLSSGAGGRGAGIAVGRRRTFLNGGDSINWVALALGTYREFVSAGLKPDLDVLDKVLACLRLPLSRSAGTGGGGGGAAGAGGPLQQAAAAGGAGYAETATLLRDLAREASAAAGETQQQIEVAFDRRAVELLSEAVGMGLLPPFTLDQPCQLDLRSLPPSVAEVYALHLLSGVEARAAGPNRRPFIHRVKLLVPPFDANYVMWPSYVEKLHLHYADELLQRQALLRAEAGRRRRRGGGGGGGGEGEEGEEEFVRPLFGNERGLLPQSFSSSEWEDADDGFEARVAAARAALRQGDPDDTAAPPPQQQRRRRGAGRRPSEAAAPLPDGHQAGAQTGLAVAATFRRLKAFARVDSARGVIRLPARELNRWSSAKARREEERRRQAQQGGGAAPVVAPTGEGGAPADLRPRPGGFGGFGAAPGMLGGGLKGSLLGGLGDQQRLIRLGMAAPALGGPPAPPALGSPGAPRQARPVLGLPPSPPGSLGKQGERQQQQQQHPAAGSSSASGTSGGGDGGGGGVNVDSAGIGQLPAPQPQQHIGQQHQQQR